MAQRLSKLRHGALLGALGATVLLVVSAGHAADSFWEKLKGDGAVMGFANEAPFAYKKPDGTLVGTDAEILMHVFEEMGITEIEAGLVDWGALIPGVRARRFDVVASGIYIKPERCEQVAFTEPLYVLGDGMIVLAGNPKNIHDFEAFVKDRSLKLANTIGATGPGDHALAMGVQPGQIVEVPDPPSQIAALKAGRVDAALNTGIQTGELVKRANDPTIERALPFRQATIEGKPAVGIAGLAFHPENEAFVAELNKRLVAFRGTPEYIAILEKYGMTKEDLPDTWMVTSELCKKEH
jgi:polar amino acid transport system substrate-binding protein